MSLKKLETSPAITVGFFGEMGCGKSSLLSVVHDSIRSTTELRDDDIQLKKFSKYRDQLLKSPLDATRDVHHFTFRDTAKSHVLTLMDTPGRLKYWAATVRGMALCDYMILVVDGRLMDSISPYVRDLVAAATCNYCDSTKLVVCINRSDQAKTDFERNFIGYATQFHRTLSRAFFKDTFKIPFIPVSAKTGDGVFTVSKSMEWYKGPTLMDCINGFAIPTRNLQSSPLRLIVDDYFHNVSNRSF
jgi:translation elongation factor EF-1alpha